MNSPNVTRIVDEKTYTWTKLKRAQVGDFLSQWGMKETPQHIETLKQIGYSKDEMKVEMGNYRRLSQQLTFGWHCVSMLRYATEVFHFCYKLANPTATDEEIEALPFTPDEVILVALELMGWKLDGS